MSKGSLLSVDAIQGAWAVLPTPSREGASSWRMEDTVDLDEAARAVEELIKAGINGIMGLGTLGESATLTSDEKRSYVAAVVDAVRGRVPVFFGTTTLNTRDTVRQTREFRDIGVDGTMLGIPMWSAPDLPVAVQFYRDVAEACPDMAICVYANTEAFKFSFPTPFWAQVSDIPQVICSKYISIGAMLLDLTVSRRRIRLLPLDMDYYGAARMDPDFNTAFWSSGAVCGPQPVLGMRDAVLLARKSGDWAPAQRLSNQLAKVNSTMLPHGSFKEFSTHNIGIEKARIDTAGWMRAGPVRPPYHLVPEAYLEGGRISGRRWAELHGQLVQEAAASRASSSAGAKQRA